MTMSPSPVANSNFRSSDSSSSNSDFLDLFHLARKERLKCSQLQRTIKRLKRGVALGAILVMFQGSSAALTSAWVDGCVDNPEAFIYCVGSTDDSEQKVDDRHTLRSAVATANGSGASSSTIGFADQLFGIIRDPSSGAITNSEANPIIGRTITLDSTLEIRTNLAIKAPTDALGSNILTIERGTGIDPNNPLISVNTPSSQTGPLVNGATVQVQIENVTIDSNANPNTGNVNAPKATSGVTIQVSQTEVTTENGPTLVTPEVVLKSTQVLNAVSESGGAAVNTSGDVRIENSTLVGNMAVSSGDGTASDGGAIKAEGTVTVVSSALNGNSATGNGGAISATTVNVSNAESSSNSQFYGNTAGRSGGAINSSGDTVISGAVLEGNTAGGISNQSIENPAAQPTATATGGNGGAVNAGGAVVVSGSQLAGNNSFTGTEVNSQSGNGGAISAGAQVAITDSNIEGNKAGMNGGAISAGGEVLVETISNPSPSSISSNQALLGSGGAISAGATVTVTNTVLHGNSAGTDGGAISSASNVVGTNTHLAGNRADTNGGAISAGGSVSVTTTAGARNSSLSSNQAISGSGGAIDAGVSVYAQNVDMSGNRAGTGGGAIRTAGEVGITTFEGTASSTLSGNRAGGDGGAVLAGGDVSVNATQMFGNSSGGNGGAISAGLSPSTVNITGSQLVGNVAGKAFNQDVLGGNGGAVNVVGNVVVSNESIMVGNRAYSTEDQTLGNGGAIYATQIVVVQNSELLYSTAGDQGGAIYAGESVVVETSQISGNTSGGNGGAIASGGTVNVTSADDQARPALGGIGDERNRSEISGNMAGGHGGAISAGSTVDISHSNLINNQAGAAREGETVVATTSGGDGGAIHTATNVTVINSVIGSNSASGGSGPGRAEGEGGGIAAAGTVVVQGSVISSNSSYGDGGAVKAETIIIAPDISRSEISSNYSEGDGGAVAASTVYVLAIPNQASELDAQLNNNVSASSGGAISAVTAVDIYRADLSGNIAAGNGGAINSEGTVEIAGSTLANNVAGGVPTQEEDDVVASFEGGSGGAIYATGDVTIFQSQFTSNESRVSFNDIGYPSNPEFPIYESGGQGGAVYSEEDVFVFGATKFESNTANDAGGAIAAGYILLDGVVLEGNSSNSKGGAIYTKGEGSFTIVENSDFSGNTSWGPGGAIYAEGVLQVNDSVFGLRIDTNQAEGSEPDFESNLAIYGQGGAIYAEGDVQIARSIFGGNISGAGGGAIASEGATSVNASLFFLNQALGNGGAIESNGIVSIENGSLLVANQAGTVNFAGWEFLFLNFYPIFGPGEMFVAPQYGGNGGAIYSHDSVIVQGSSVGTLPPIGAPDASVFSNKALCSGYWSDESVDRYWIQECGFFREDGMWISLGNGGGIYAAGQVTIEGSETDYEFNLQTFSFNSKESSFESSYLTNNYAQNRGGAVYASGGVQVDDAVFGSTSEINPNYNPERRIRNPLWDPNINQNFMIINRVCDGLDEFSDSDGPFCSIDGIRHQYFLLNENYQDEFVYELDDATKEFDPKKFYYAGNDSDDSGGAIYVEGPTLITNSIFSGNTSGDDGGAIYSEGALEIKDSTFSRNWADDDGGAIKTTPGEGDLLIARTAFIENLSMDDGGAIDISTGEQPHYDDLILSSLFRDNEAFGPGGAIDSSFAILILNTFENNDSPDGHALHLHGGILSGNKLIGTTSSSFQFSLDLCSHSIYTEFNFTTDESCFAGQGDEFISVDNVLLSHAQMTDPAATLTLPSNYSGTLLENIKRLPEFYFETPSESNPAGILSEFGSFITNELNKDFNSAIRDSSVLWNPGHIQSIFPTSIVTPEVDNPVVNEGTDDQVVVVPPSSNNQDSPILILGPVLSTEELARLAAQRAEQMAAELKRQQEAERAAAERLAKIKADKLAREKARALAAEKRRAQLAALKAKIAATQARGEALKKKPSWINLMKNSSAQKVVKKLVVSPAK